MTGRTEGKPRRKIPLLESVAGEIDVIKRGSNRRQVPPAGKRKRFGGLGQWPPNRVMMGRTEGEQRRKIPLLESVAGEIDVIKRGSNWRQALPAVVNQKLTCPRIADSVFYRER